MCHISTWCHYSGQDNETGQQESNDALPADLETYVNEDNTRFDEEIEEWDTEQKRKALQKVTPTGGEDVMVVGEVKGCKW